MTARTDRRLPAHALRPGGAPRVRPFHRGPAQRRPGDRFCDGHGPDAAQVDVAAQRHQLPAQPAPHRRLLPDEGRGRPVQPGRAAAPVSQDRRGLRARQLPGQDTAAAAGDRGRRPGRELHRRAGAAVRWRGGVRRSDRRRVADDRAAAPRDARREGGTSGGRHNRVGQRQARSRRRRAGRHDPPLGRKTASSGLRPQRPDCRRST